MFQHKKQGLKFGGGIKKHYLCSRNIGIGPWCNGNTTGFGSVIMGSSPVGPTPEKPCSDVRCAAFPYPHVVFRRIPWRFTYCFFVALTGVTCCRVTVFGNGPYRFSMVDRVFTRLGV